MKTGLPGYWRIGVFRFYSAFLAFGIAHAAMGQEFVDVDQLVDAYLNNPINADLIYKGKSIALNATVEQIVNARPLYMGMVGTIIFYNLSKRYPSEWSCTVDTDHVQDIAQLRVGDRVALSGQFVSLSSLFHCTVMPKPISTIELMPDSSSGFDPLTLSYAPVKHATEPTLIFEPGLKRGDSCYENRCIPKGHVDIDELIDEEGIPRHI